MRSHSRNSFIISALAALIGVGLFVYTYMMIRGTVTEAAYLRGDLAAALNEQTAVYGAEKTLTGSTAELATIDSYFVTSDGSVAFISYLESLGRKAGADLSIQNINVVAGAPADFKDTLSVQLTITGTWDAVVQTLALLEQVPYHLNVASLDMSRQDTTVGKKTVIRWQAAAIVEVLKVR